jgi:hypothetical protein
MNYLSRTVAMALKTCSAQNLAPERNGSEEACKESNNFSVGSVAEEHFNLLGQGLAVYSR